MRYLSLASFGGIVLLAIACQQSPTTPPPSSAAAPAADPAKRGEYLVSVLGCDDCHTPKTMTPQGPAPDMGRRLMGHPVSEPFSADAAIQKLVDERHLAIFSAGMTAAAGPWGVTYAANLTPDDTGIGPWTEAQFVKALREGKSKGLDGTRPIMPPMPIAVYRNLEDDDIEAIFAYLRTIAPVSNVVPAPALAPPPPAG
jgi:mono/diheme cytochrome c family protein